MASTALYYPFLLVRDPNWLKAAFLYWEDGLYRIAPSYMHHIEGEDAEVSVAVAEDKLRNADPFAVLGEAEGRFMRDVFRPARADGYLKKVLTDTGVRRAGERLHLQNAVTFLFEKVSHNLQERLEIAGAGRQEDGLFQMTPEFAASYMAILGETLSERRQIPLVTEDYHVRRLRRFVGTEAVTAHDEIGLLLDARIGFPHPNELARVPHETNH